MADRRSERVVRTIQRVVGASSLDEALRIIVDELREPYGIWSAYLIVPIMDAGVKGEELAARVVAAAAPPDAMFNAGTIIHGTLTPAVEAYFADLLDGKLMVVHVSEELGLVEFMLRSDGINRGILLPLKRGETVEAILPLGSGFEGPLTADQRSEVEMLAVGLQDHILALANV